MEKEHRVILFPGAFDPPHKGHLEAARRAIERLSGKINLWFLPCSVKSKAFSKNVIASNTERLRMLQSAIKSSSYMAVRELASVCTEEFDLNDGAGQYVVIKRLLNKAPNIEFHYLMGEDQADKIRTWRKSRDLTKMLPFIIVKRQGLRPPCWASWTKNPPNVKVEVAYPSSVRSSAIRKELFFHGDFKEELLKHLPATVLEFIMANDIYKERF